MFSLKEAISATPQHPKSLWDNKLKRAGGELRPIDYLWKEQEGRCVVCGQPLRIAEEDYQIHHRIWRSRGGPDTADNLELLHANCHRQTHVRERRAETAASREGRS
jgi:5-methylcytosine-specific restriction endonuclease McrA